MINHVGMAHQIKYKTYPRTNHILNSHNFSCFNTFWGPYMLSNKPYLYAVNDVIFYMLDQIHKIVNHMLNSLIKLYDLLNKHSWWVYVFDFSWFLRKYYTSVRILCSLALEISRFYETRDVRD